MSAWRCYVCATALRFDDRLVESQRGKQAMRVKVAKILFLLLVVVGAGGYLWWRQGTPYQDRIYSPNRQYYIQKYSNLTLSRFIGVMPGQGSDTIDGYIRLYAADGTLIHERFETFIRDIRPVWDGRNVYLLGVAEMDTDPWILPLLSE